MFSAELRADPVLKGNVKYRNSPFVRGDSVASRIAVSNGNFSNKNIWADNSVELGISWRQAQESNYIIITHSIADPNVAVNPPMIPWTRIAGEIHSTMYVNDNNVNISYVVDHYTSAQLTEELRGGFFTGAQGLVNRTNLTYPAESKANQLPEPFSGNDIKVHHPDLTEQLNASINGSLGITQTGTHPIDNGYCFVVYIFTGCRLRACRHAGATSLFRRGNNHFDGSPPHRWA